MATGSRKNCALRVREACQGRAAGGRAPSAGARAVRTIRRSFRARSVTERGLALAQGLQVHQVGAHAQGGRPGLDEVGGGLQETPPVGMISIWGRGAFRALM